MLYIPDDDKLAEEEENGMNDFDINGTGPASNDKADAAENNAYYAKNGSYDTQDLVIEDFGAENADFSINAPEKDTDDACSCHDQPDEAKDNGQTNDAEIISGVSPDYEMDKESYNIQNIDEENSTKAESGLQDDQAKENGKNKKSFLKSLIYDLIFYAVLIFVCIYIIPNFVLQRTIVDGSSMENTLKDREQLYVEKISYHFNALKRFDIIVFYPYGRENEDYYVKRIIGMPGEKVQIIDGRIYINDELLEENYGKEPIEDPGRAAEPIYLGEDEYFVLGDNRNRSKDSRSEQVGNVKKENIGGRVILRIYPFDRFGFVD